MTLERHYSSLLCDCHTCTNIKHQFLFSQCLLGNHLWPLKGYLDTKTLGLIFTSITAVSSSCISFLNIASSAHNSLLFLSSSSLNKLFSSSISSSLTSKIIASVLFFLKKIEKQCLNYRKVMFNNHNNK